MVVTRRETDERATDSYDASLPFPVHRLPGPLLPSASLARRVGDILRDVGATRVVIGAAAPLGLLAEPLRRAGAERVVALSHGHEVWWSQVPGPRRVLRRIAHDVDALGVISGHTARHISSAIAPEDRHKLVQLPPPVDLDLFTPGGSPEPGLVLAASRLVRQKGVDKLLDAWPLVTAARPDSRLLVVGDGPQRRDLERRAARLQHVRLLRGVSHERMPGLLRTASLFVSPVRTRLGGLYAEGLGLAACEAAACGLPVVVGDSGGAPETVVAGVTGTVVDSADPTALADAVIRWLSDPDSARTAGLAGRRHVADLVGASRIRERLRATLSVGV